MKKRWVLLLTALATVVLGWLWEFTGAAEEVGEFDDADDLCSRLRVQFAGRKFDGQGGQAGWRDVHGGPRPGGAKRARYLVRSIHPGETQSNCPSELAG